MKKNLLMLMALLWLQTAEAQFLKKLTDKVKDKVSGKINRKVDDKVNQTIDKTTDKVEKKLSDTASKAKKEAKTEQLTNNNILTDSTSLQKKKANATKKKSKDQ